MRELYSELMREAPAHIVVTIDVQEPVELLDFVSMFTALANQYEKFMRVHHPDLDGEAKIFVREVRTGSIEADLIPWALAIISHMDRILIVEQFVRLYASRLKSYFVKDGRADDVTKSDLNDFMRSVAAIANDPNGRCSIRSVAYEEGERYVRAGIKFDTKQAKRATEEIERHKIEIEKRENADHENVLMRFYQSNLRDTDKTGEKVVIESISDRPLPIVYVSDLSKQRIKSEIMYGDRNIFKRGFFVDVNVETVRGRVVAYRLVNVRDVIELPPDIDK